MSLRAPTRRIPVLVTGVFAAALLLTACADDVPEVSDGNGAQAPETVEPLELGEPDAPAESAAANNARDLDGTDFPSCEVIERQVGAGLEALELADEELHTAESAMDSSHKTCMWVTELYEDLENADANTLMEAVHTGVLTMSINVPPQPLTEADAAAVGYAFHDLRAQRAGGYVFAPEDTDLNGPLGMMGVTVSVDGVDVTWGGGTYFDGQGDQIAEQFNKDWGVEAAVTVHRLIWD